MILFYSLMSVIIKNLPSEEGMNFVSSTSWVMVAGWVNYILRHVIFFLVNSRVAIFYKELLSDRAIPNQHVPSYFFLATSRYFLRMHNIGTRLLREVVLYYNGALVRKGRFVFILYLSPPTPSKIYVEFELLSFQTRDIKNNFIN